jgi:hypothetical protein
MPSKTAHAIPLPKRLPAPVFKYWQRVRVLETSDTGRVIGVIWDESLCDWFFVVQLDEGSCGLEFNDTETEVAAALEPVRSQRRRAK